MSEMNEQTYSPLVSIVVPMYNQRRHLDDCLKSITCQTYKNIEVIVVNDGSTDDSPLMAKKWAARDDRVKVIDKPNAGAILARLDGYRIAKGDFIAFVDSDDLLPKNAIDILAGHIVEKDVDLVIGSMTRKLAFIKQAHSDKSYTFPINQVVTQPELFDKYYSGFFRKDIFPISMCARLYRKSVIDKAIQETTLCDKDVTLMGEDQFFNMKLFPFLTSVYRTDETVYIYRYGGGTNRFNPNFTQLFTMSDKRLNQLDRYNYSPGYGPLFDEYILCLYFHASRLISCKVEDKQGVIDFFKHEVDNRELMPRLEAYYAENPTTYHEVNLLLKHDYEGMYQYACDLVQQRKGSLKQRVRSMVISVLKKFS